MKLVAGLILNTEKWFIIPLVSKYSFYFSQYKESLDTHIPAWSDFSIATHAEYLGFEVGPTAGENQWTKVMLSFNKSLTVLYLKSYRRRGVCKGCV